MTGKQTDLMAQQSQELVDPSAGQMLRFAIERGVDAETIERLVLLKERMDDRAASREFAQAKAAFQRECPVIAKTREGARAERGRGAVLYNYAPLEEIVGTVGPLLQRHGFTYRWDSTTTGNVLTCIFKLRHEGGHEEHASFTCPATSASPAMSEQQKHAGALRFAMRYSMIQGLALVTVDDDSPDDDLSTVTEEQAANLRATVEQYGLDAKLVLEYANAASFEVIRAADFGRVMQAVQKRGRG